MSALENFKCLDFLDAARFVVDFNNGVWFRLFDVRCWALWNSRNDLVYNGKSKATPSIFAEAFAFIEVFDVVHKEFYNTLSSRQHTLVPAERWIDEAQLRCIFIRVNEWCRARFNGA